MRKPLVFATFALVSAGGVAIVALPDSGPRFAISDAHGPGMLDAAGIVLLLAGSSILWGYLWSSRESLKRAPSRWRNAWLFGTGLGTGLLIASVASDFSAWWMVGAALLTAVQLSLFFAARDS